MHEKRDKSKFKFFIIEKFKKKNILLPAFHLIIWAMKQPIDFEKVATLTIYQLFSFRGIKTHFGKLALK